MDSFRDVCEDLGAHGERSVAEMIRARGLAVCWDGRNAPHDLVVDGSTTVEVKTALASAANGKRHDRWQFNLFKNDGNHRPFEEDVLVLRCQEKRQDGRAWHFVVPGSVVPAGLTKIDITQSPEVYRGRFSLFLEAWELLDAVVALRSRDGRQIPLPATERIPF